MQKRWCLGVSLIVGLLLQVSSARAVASSSQSKEEPKADCSFSNPRLPSWCNVTIPMTGHSTPQQTCETVLRCIQNSACVDANKYCNNPGVPARDWKLESASKQIVIAPDTPRVNCGYSNPGY